MNEQEETYLHFVYSIESLNRTWRILNQIKEQNDNSLAGYAFQFALIEYSKPYKTSYGLVVERHRLSEVFIPPNHIGLHKRILDSRDKFHAHTDLKIREPILHKYGNFIGWSENIIDGIEEMKNIDEIIDLVEKTLDAMYEEQKKLKDNLPVAKE